MAEFSLAALRNLLPQMRGANFGTTSAQEDADMPLSELDRAARYALPFSAQPRSAYDETVKYQTVNPLVSITEGDIGRATEAAMGVSGGGMKLETPKGIRAYHSSPHDFDKFDLAKIGSGEGAQVYGHGLYFAESPAVSGQGGQYWNQFKNRFTGPEGLATDYLKTSGFDRAKAADLLEKRGKVLSGETDDLYEQLFGKAPPFVGGGMSDYAQAEKLLRSGKPVGPRTYEVNINADPAHMLDWDKPINAQSDIVKSAMGQHIGPRVGTWGEMKERFYAPMDEILKGTEAGRFTKGEHYFTPGAIDLPSVIESVGPEKAAEINALLAKYHRDFDMPGGDAWKSVVEKHGAEDASNFLREAGIPGIKYLDQGSRGMNTQILSPQETVHGKWLVKQIPNGQVFYQGADEAAARAAFEAAPKPSNNYVIFDPNLIRIDKKYAVPGAVGAGGLMSLQALQDQQQPRM